jgi:transposase InsO family protein
MIRNKLIRMAATAWSLASIARDLWSGLNAGSLHYDPDGDLIDEDPPRPDVVWGGDFTQATARAGGFDLVVHRYDTMGGTYWSWMVHHQVDRTEEACGRTERGEGEAKRRAEEALAVMLELQT